MDVTLKVRRFNPETDQAPHFETYQVPANPMDRVLDLLHYVKWNIDGSLTFRRSCAHGICGSDAMLINGANHLACKVLVRELGDQITVEALRGLPLVKDLLVDMEPFFRSYRSVLPYLINDEPEPDTERRQSPAERERFDDTTKCILCAACTTSCPVFWTDEEYFGPAAEVLGQEPLGVRVEAQPVAGLGEAVALVLEQQVLVGDALVPHGRDDLFALGLLDPRVVGPLDDQHRDPDLLHPRQRRP